MFIDGQNLYKHCRELFLHPLCHPHLLAEHLAGPRTQNRVSTRFYTGRPSPNMPDERVKARNLDRRLAVIRRMGATVQTRRLRYHWDWGHREKLPQPGEGVTPQTVILWPWQRPREKGIDLLIGLDVVEFALTGLFDVGIVVSLDSDLREIPSAIRNLRAHLTNPVRIEAAVPVGPLHTPKTLAGFAYTHQITREVFERIRDDTDYTVPEEEWYPPVPPASLADLSAPN